jgi:hypothetical protein
MKGLASYSQRFLQSSYRQNYNGLPELQKANYYSPKAPLQLSLCIQHNDIQYNDTQHNVIQHNNK